MANIQIKMSNFVNWIAPDPKTVPEFKKHADDVLERIKAKAIEKDIPVFDNLIGGSFDKKTGLRRHMLGTSEVEGQDIDLVFVVNNNDDGKHFEELVSRFSEVATLTYPATEKQPTKCSVQLMFANPLVTYDLVPVYKTEKPKHQLLVRTDLEKRLTSVQLHSEFVKKRTTKSQGMTGCVEFNECIRLAKWWKHEFSRNSYYFKDGLPSVVIELLFAKVFDDVGVQKNYAETLIQWFSKAAHYVENRTTIYFNDYVAGSPAAANESWRVLDAVNFDNNVVKKWSDGQINDLLSGLKKATAELTRAVRHDMFDEANESTECLSKVFGNAFKNHCEGN